jgi:hypothetical protein
MGTEDIAFDRLGQIDTLANRLERQRLDHELAAVMKDVVADSRRSSPTERRGVLPERPAAAPAPAGTGWREPPPLRLPPGQDLIERMVNAALPHGPGHRRKPDDEPPKAA